PALLFADDLRQDHSAVHLPLVQCNACHTTAWAGFKPAAQTRIIPDLRAIYSAFFSRSPDLMLLLPLLPDEPEPAVNGMTRWLCGGCGYLQGEGEQCQGCGEHKLQRVFYPDNRRQRSVQGASRLVYEHICPVCETRDSLLVFGARVASLGSVALSHLYASAYNDDPKLIAFSDSVQDAAHRAGFFSARTWLSNMRMAITQALAKHPDDTIPLPVFYDYLPRFWQDKSLNPAAFERERFIAEFLAPNMQWLPDFQTLCKTGVLPADSHLLDDIHKRLQWEVLAEFGYRSRIGRTLVRTATAAAGIELAPVQLAALRLLTPLREEFGLRALSNKELTWFLLGFVLRLQHKGAIYHPFLDAYIADGGRTYILNRQSYLPAFAPSTPAPVMLTDATRHTGFDTLHGRWYQDWCKRTLGRQQLLPQNCESDLYRLVLDALTEAGVVKAIRAGKNTVWCLQPETLYLSADNATLATDGQRSTLCVPARMAAELVGLPALEHSDHGDYQVQPQTRHWLSRLYRQGRIQRVMAAEHTGLLDSEDRQLIEQDFIKADKPWSPNLLSATPTLEMGINIGALSSVLLCSVPPTQANYLQRIGRAGRRDGNAFSLTLAAGRAHDLYFYAQPEQMMAGRIDAPGVFLNASAVIERQLVAYCMDRWVASGIDDSAMPRTLRPVLDHVQKGNLKSFPYNFIAFCQREALPILEEFLGLFGNELHERTRQYLRHVLLGGDDSIESLELQLVKRLTELVKERERLSSRIDALKRHIDKLERQPQDEVLLQEINEARQERSGLQAIKRRINGKETLNFFTDEGLIPNYAFPEAGVLLRSVIYWRRTRTDDGRGKYESRVYEYERP
ncbi:MAG: hypothetical protein KDK04_25770, partial [Candidatus Competibacteraceae bacterium]|nr:hypothetical protein [Candidatus Competibacteraceae bacterium]